MAKRASKSSAAGDDAVQEQVDAGHTDEMQTEDNESSVTAPDADKAHEEVGEPQSLQARVGELQAKADEHWDRLLRTQAEMENLRKRSQRDVENAHKYALEGFASDLLGVKDSLEMGLNAASQEDSGVTSIREGTELTLKLLTQTMEKHNIMEINPLGEKFDPELHQAMNVLEDQNAAPNTVLMVIQKGYLLNGRLLRPALVSVAK